MKKSSWKDAADAFGTLAIVGSLIFVGFEIKQSREIAIADVYQQQAALLVAVQTSGDVPERLFEARQKFRAGEELSQAEINLLRSHHNPWLTYYENVHFQYQAGLLSEEHWVSVKNEIRRGNLNAPYFLDYWESVRGSWRQSFSDEIDQIIQEETAKTR